MEFQDAVNAVAEMRKARVLAKSGRVKKALAIYDGIVSRLTSRIYEQRALVAEVLLNKGVDLHEAGRIRDAMVTYAEIIDKYGDRRFRHIVGLGEYVSLALINKAVALGDREYEEAINLYDEVVNRYGESSGLDPSGSFNASNYPPYRRCVVMALVYKAGQLYTLGYGDEAATISDDVLARFGVDDIPEMFEIDPEEKIAIDSLIAKTLIDKAIWLRAAGRHNESITECSKASSFQPNNYFAFYHRGQTWLDKGEFEHAVIDFAKAFQLDAGIGEYLSDDRVTELRRSGINICDILLRSPYLFGKILEFVTDGLCPDEILDALKKRGVSTYLLKLISAELTKRRSILQLPENAPEIYSKRKVRPELGRKEKIGEFMVRVWSRYMDPQAGPLTRQKLRDLDDSADRAIHNWVSYHRALPPGVHLPTLSETNDDIELNEEDRRELSRVLSASYRRAPN